MSDHEMAQPWPDIGIKLRSLWHAANNHSTAVIGEWIVDPDDYEGDETPPYPGDEQAIDMIIEYLDSTI